MTTPADAKPQPKRHRGEGEIFLVGRIWHVRYRVRGQRRKESSGSTRRNDAVKLLNRRRGENADRKRSTADAEKVTFDDLAQLIREDYEANGQKSVDRLEISLAHLRPVFENIRAIDIRPADLTAYRNLRRKATPEGKPGASSATIKNELAALRRAFTLALESDMLESRPAFPKIEVHNARQGFLTDADFNAIIAQLHNRAYIAPLTFAFLSGYRLASEVLTLEWRTVDLDAGTLKLEPNTVTKNRKGRTLPTRALPELHQLLVDQRAFVSQIEREQGIVCPLVFPRLNGSAIKSLRGAWNAAAARAGLADSIPHDMRRSTAMRYTAAGVPRSTAMALAGWQTEDIFNRYNLVPEGELVAGLTKVAEHRAANAKKRNSSVAGKIGPRTGPKSGKIARKA